MQAYPRQIGWNKKGKALRVVVMQMAEQQDDFRRLPARQLATEWDDPCPRVQDDRPLPHANLNARRVASVTHRARARSRIAPAYTPEFDPHLIGHSTPPQYLDSFHSNFTFIILILDFDSRKVFASEVRNNSHIFSLVLR
jgi:hypothetical protein